MERTSTTEFDAQDFANFMERGGGRSKQPSLTPDDIAKAVLRLIQDDTLNGISYGVVLGEEWQLLPRSWAQEVLGRK